MSIIREILVNWSSAASPGGVSVLHVGSSTSVAAQRIAVNDALTALTAIQHTGTVYTVAQDGRELDDTTGTLTGTWSDSTPFTDNGQLGEPVPNAAQGLIRMTTALVVDGRIVKGRLYVPGIAASRVTLGEVNAATQGVLSTAFADMRDSGELLIWSRPRAAGSGVNGDLPARLGSSAPVTGLSGWSELAVMRSRR